MPRKVEPKRGFTRVFRDTRRPLSVAGMRELRKLLGDRTDAFLPHAERLASRYQQWKLVLRDQPKAAEIRAALSEIYGHADAIAEHADALISALDRLDNDSADRMYLTILDLAGDTSKPMAPDEIADTTSSPKMEPQIPTLPRTRLIDILWLVGKTQFAMNWLTRVARKACDDVATISRRGRPEGALKQLARETVYALERIGLPTPTMTRDGTFEQIVRVLLQEAGAPPAVYVDRDLLPELRAAINSARSAPPPGKESPPQEG